MGLRAAIIGYGYMGEIRRAVVERTEGLELLGVCETDEARRARIEGTDTFADWRALLDEGPDCVFVCTPNRFAPEITVEALSRDMHVFCEKPPGRTVSDIRAMREAEVAHPDAKLMFGFNHRWHPGVLKGKVLVDSGRLGKVIGLRGVYGKSGGVDFRTSWRNDPEMSGGGILLDQGIHMLDLFRVFCGDFQHVKAFVADQYWKTGLEDNAWVALQNDLGQGATLHSSATLWKHTFRIDVICEEGYLVVDGLLSKTGSYGREQLVVGRRQFEDEAEAVGNPAEEVTYFDRDASWDLEVAEWVRCIRDDAPVTVASSHDALRVMEIIEAAYADAAGEGGAGTMKNIVIFDDYTVRDLKPPVLLKEYMALTERGVAAMLVPAATLEVPCPACHATEVASTFVKSGLTYRECGNCRSLYVSPRPDDAALARYDAESEARRYWRETLAPASGAARREKIVKPRSEWVADSTREHLPDASVLVDVATAQYGYVEELAAEGLFERVELLDPLVAVPADAGAAGVGVTHTGEAPDPAGAVDVVTLLEVADRTSDVDALFSRVTGMLRRGGLAFVTAILVTGFDLQVLWDRADNVFPPDRLNVFSVDGLNILFDRHGLEPLEFSTPGILDVEIVVAALERDPALEVPRWARYIASRDERTRRDFQAFLQSELLSSYGRVVLRKA